MMLQREDRIFCIDKYYIGLVGKEVSLKDDGSASSVDNLKMKLSVL